MHLALLPFRLIYLWLRLCQAKQNLQTFFFYCLRTDQEQLMQLFLMCELISVLCLCVFDSALTQDSKCDFCMWILSTLYVLILSLTIGWTFHLWSPASSSIFTVTRTLTHPADTQIQVNLCWLFDNNLNLNECCQNLFFNYLSSGCDPGKNKECRGGDRNKEGAKKGC